MRARGDEEAEREGELGVDADDSGGEGGVDGLEGTSSVIGDDVLVGDRGSFIVPLPSPSIATSRPPWLFLQRHTTTRSTP